MANVLGISAYYHDSAAALTIDGRIVAAAQEERFSRVKNDAQFPQRAAQSCLATAGLLPSQLDAVVYYEKPFLTFERILETTLAVAPRGFRFFSKALPVWVHEKLFLKSMLKKALSETFGESFSDRLYFSEHHLSHAAAAYYPSPFEEAAILTVDGVGEWKTLTISHGRGNKITELRSMSFPHSWGLFYAAVTTFLGFKVNSGEYKMMGLAPYGREDTTTTQEFKKKMQNELMKVGDDGSLHLNPYYFAFTTSDKMIHGKRWERLFGLKQRTPESELSHVQADFALAAQKILEEGLLRLAVTARELTNCSNLVMSGGVALNCVANSHLKKQGIFNQIWIQPASGDAGSALGAALAFEHLRLESPRHVRKDAMAGALLGPEYSVQEIEQALQIAGLKYKPFADFNDLCETSAALLQQQNVVGWFQGRMEFGPRALGNRSILASATNAEMQTRLNQKIKYRETFRPFAPIVLAEDVQDYFDWEGASRYMLFTASVKQSRQVAKPKNFSELCLRDQLNTVRSDIPSVTHLDYSARLQTVHQETNSRLHQLLRTYKAHSGHSILINTSFNVRGEPIVCTPADAIRCFLNTEMDVLVLGSFMILKTANHRDSQSPRQTDGTLS